MSVATYLYTGGVDGSNSWVNLNNLWDASKTTYAYSSASNAGDPNGSAIGQTLPTLTNLGTITQVRIGTYAYYSGSSPDTCRLRPYFNGTTAGTDSSDLSLGTSAADIWYDITADSAGPGANNWTWTNVQNLYVHLRNTAQQNKTTNYYGCVQVEVTYTPTAGGPFPFFIQAEGRTNG